jgi:hypothetical protein
MTKKDRYIKKAGPTAKATSKITRIPKKSKIPWSNQYGDSRTWGKKGGKGA